MVFPSFASSTVPENRSAFTSVWTYCLIASAISASLDTAAAPAVSSDAEMAEAIKQYVQTLVKADLFSGTVLLAKDGKTIYAGAFGEANKDFGVPNKLDTKFNLG